MNRACTSRTLIRTAFAVAALLAAAACGDDGNPNASPGTSATDSPPAPTVDTTTVTTTSPPPTTRPMTTPPTPPPDPTVSPTPEPTDGPATTDPPTTVAMPDRPTIVLVHGAFAGPSSWDAVVPLLEAQGFDVVIPTNPLRGPSADAAALRDTLARVVGDVVIVGHSYGGIPITNAATGDPDVRALVYVAAYVPGEGDTFAQIQERLPGALTPDVLVVAPYTTPDGTQGAAATIAVDAFPALFAADVPTDQAAAMAARQMPLDLNALGEPSGPPAWQDIPSWYLVATADQIIPADLARQMAANAGATVEEIDASHAVLVSEPDVVADLIARAAAAS